MPSTTVTVPAGDGPDYLEWIGFEKLQLTQPGTNTKRSATKAEADAWLAGWLAAGLRTYRKQRSLAAVAEPADSNITAA